MPYRPHGKFSGDGANKRLSAHSIATYMFLQDVTNFEDLTSEFGMNAALLRGLLRGRAVEWWENLNQRERPGEPAWLVFDGRFMRLTAEGLSKIGLRIGGGERTASGRRSSYNVSPLDVSVALNLITNGSRNNVSSFDTPYIEV